MPEFVTEPGYAQASRYCASHQTRVLTLFFSDLVGSTELQSSLGNLRAADLVKRHREVLRETLARLDGQEVETAGDSFLAMFAAPSEGVKFALHLQAAMRRSRDADPELPPVRAGLHQGQVVVEEHPEGRKPMEIYGLQVSIAARIMDLAEGGQVLCTRAVFDDARAILTAADLSNLAPISWLNHGTYRFKGVDDAYEVCEAGEVALAPLSAPPAGNKAWPAESRDDIYGWRPGPEAILPNTHWRLEQKLGEGGFGEVWLARHDRQARLKTVFKFCTKLSKLGSLQRELNVFASLSRQGQEETLKVVEILDAHDDGEPPFYVQMRYVAGGNLRDWIDGAGKSASMDTRLHVAAQMIEAATQIHAAGFVHRDIKPSNFLIEAARGKDDAPRLRISDFGIGQEVLRDALQQGQDSGLLPREGGRFELHSESLWGAAGTHLFIAPELYLRSAITPGKLAKEALPAADIYSLAVSLYQLFAGSTYKVPGVGLRDVQDTGLRDLLAECLDPEPMDRPTALQLGLRMQWITRMRDEGEERRPPEMEKPVPARNEKKMPSPAREMKNRLDGEALVFDSLPSHEGEASIKLRDATTEVDSNKTPVTSKLPPDLPTVQAAPRYPRGQVVLLWLQAVFLTSTCVGGISRLAGESRIDTGSVVLACLMWFVIASHVYLVASLARVECLRGTRWKVGALYFFQAWISCNLLILLVSLYWSIDLSEIGKLFFGFCVLTVPPLWMPACVLLFLAWMESGRLPSVPVQNYERSSGPSEVELLQFLISALAFGAFLGLF